MKPYTGMTRDPKTGPSVLKSSSPIRQGERDDIEASKASYA